MAATVSPVSPDVGVEVAGLTGPRLVDPAVAAECQALLEKHGVVIYREVHVEDADLVAFSRMLGTVVVAPMGGMDGLPEVSKITLDPAESVLAAYRRGTFFWHLDGANDELPQKATLLTARQVSDEGGDTEFANTYAAYDALPADEKEQFARLRVVHSFAASQALAEPDASPKTRASWERVPAREHPLVWTRRSGRRSLLVGATASHVVGWPEEDSRALLDRLLAWSTQPRFVLRHHWRPGDLVIWDNTGMLHRAIPYTATSHRLMHRTTLRGEEVVA
ncbi:taurine catabolism dioxygenase TauD [Parafrankia colletiae]|uniref:Taurine catabolism dioxygenase TauD n=1 Tax=Parafrankia colletiae TaxID=573497 RepID=A0A1S1R6N5_9ACTN|nr:TauD/TfdA family dioxygenase [Parafrankia colletiae]MCK9903220.1 TauD/TfdA family dioxygenase [Frankia sp. Cpl3]OHV41145.1 taurine catabolism dioxygenase TauD [Parafrankia colletiae]